MRCFGELWAQEEVLWSPRKKPNTELGTCHSLQPCMGSSSAPAPRVHAEVTPWQSTVDTVGRARRQFCRSVCVCLSSTRDRKGRVCSRDSKCTLTLLSSEPGRTPLTYHDSSGKFRCSLRILLSLVLQATPANQSTERRRVMQSLTYIKSALLGRALRVPDQESKPHLPPLSSWYPL